MITNQPKRITSGDFEQLNDGDVVEIDLPVDQTIPFAVRALSGNLVPLDTSAMLFRYADTAQQVSDLSAIDVFNKKYKDGVTRLKMDLNDVEIGEYLFKNRKKLDFNQLGELLGDPKYTTILQGFIDSYDFKSMDFTMALRIIMTDFKFPGEAQKIDRVMQAFANAYMSANRTNKHLIIADVDAAYILAMASVMLNVDAHNPTIKNDKKMTAEQFIANLRGCNNGADFSADFLSKIYKDIVLNEIKRPQKISAKAGVLSNYEKWCRGQGGYQFGYLTRHYVVDRLMSPSKSVNSNSKR